MTYATYGYANSNQATTVTSHTLALPTGQYTPINGDLMYALFPYQAASAVTSTWPGGWTRAESAATTFNLAYAYKWAGASEAAFSVTTTVAARSSGRVYVFKGAHASTAPERGTEVVNVGTAPNPPALNPTNWDVEDTLWLAIVAIANQSGTASAAPTSYVDLVSHNSAGGTSAGSALVHATRTNRIASEDPSTFTTSPSTSYRCNTIGIRPWVPNPGSDPPIPNRIYRRRMTPLLAR